MDTIQYVADGSVNLGQVLWRSLRVWVELTRYVIDSEKATSGRASASARFPVRIEYSVQVHVRLIKCFSRVMSQPRDTNGLIGGIVYSSIQMLLLGTNTYVASVNALAAGDDQ